MSKDKDTSKKQKKQEVKLPKYERKDESSTEVHLDITVPSDKFEDIYEEELKKLAEDFEAKGFRKGKAPLEMVEKSKGRDAIEATLRKVMPVLTVSVLEEEDLKPVIPITYRVLSIEDKDNIQFRAVVALIPDVEIPDLKKVDVEKEDVEVEDKEVDAVIKRIWQEHKGEAKNRDDEWVKSISSKLGFESKTMDELKEEVKKSVKMEKTRIAEQKYGSEALQKAIEMADVEVPEAAVHFEMEERERSFNQQLKQINATPEQFCKIRNTTMEELKEQWHKDAHKALENDVFLSKYAEDRDIKVTEKELEKEIEHIKEHSKQKADESTYKDPQWRSYIRRVLLKRKSYQNFLSEIGGSKGKKSKKKAEAKKSQKTDDKDGKKGKRENTKK